MDVAREAAEDLAAVLRHDDDLLEPHAELAREIHARLDAEDHALLEPRLVARHDPRRFVTREAEAVPGAVGEERPEPRLLDRAARSRVDVAAAHAGAHGRERGLHRGLDRAV